MDINYDIHCHTYLSVCAQEDATIDYYADAAKRLGIKTLGIADHMWSSKIPFTQNMRESLFAQDGNFVTDWYKVQDFEHCKKIKEDINDTDTQGVRFLFGGEVEYCEGIGVAITEEEAAQLDFMVVPNSHTHHLMHRSWYEPYSKHGEYMLRATMDIINSPVSRYVTSLAHPFSAVECPYPTELIIDTIKDSQFEEVFCAAKEAGIAAEINTSCFRAVKDYKNFWATRVLGIAKKCGCKFTFGSDSHERGYQDCFKEIAGHVVDALGIKDEDILII